MNVTISTVASTRFDMETRGRTEGAGLGALLQRRSRDRALLRDVAHDPRSMMEAKGWFTVTDMIRARSRLILRAGRR